MPELDNPFESFTPITPELQSLMRNELRKDYESVIEKMLAVENAQRAYYETAMKKVGFDGVLPEVTAETMRGRFTFDSFMYVKYGAKLKRNTIDSASATYIQSLFRRTPE